MTACHFVRLGRGGLLAKDAVQRGYIAVDYGMADDFTDRFSDELAAFNRTNIPCFPEPTPGKTKVAAGLACGTIWTVGKGIQEGD